MFDDKPMRPCVNCYPWLERCLSNSLSSLSTLKKEGFREHTGPEDDNTIVGKKIISLRCSNHKQINRLMACSSSSTTVSVFSSQSWNYVFSSFRGEDNTRKSFVDHLYTALDQKGIHTYKDAETLPRGDSISKSLINAIEKSFIEVILFSKNYANSTWCLDELTNIMKCRETKQIANGHEAKASNKLSVKFR